MRKFNLGLLQYFLFLPILALLTSPLSAQQETLCAKVKMEIKQELTLERQAFEATMTINNAIVDTDLTDVSIVVNFRNKYGADAKSLFFYSASSTPANNFTCDNAANVRGTVPASSTSVIKWLIIPSINAGGNNPNGVQYSVGATLNYKIKGVENVTEVIPDSIYVKPLPDLKLDYFIPNQVYADNPATLDIIEPPVPFNLGLRVGNVGYGTAHYLKIDSGQPKIIDETAQGLLASFKILGCYVNDQPRSNSLLADFGNIAPQKAGVARWEMTSSLSGMFNEFTASVSHSNELGGRLTSLIKPENLRTHLLIHDVIVDLPGRDSIRDFLAKDGDIYRVYESELADTEVAELAIQNPIFQNGVLSLTHHFQEQENFHGFFYIKVADPNNGTMNIASAARVGGKSVNSSNVWLSKTRNSGNLWEYFINVFGCVPQDDSNVDLTFNIAFSQPEADLSPVIGEILNKVVPLNEQLLFGVNARTANGVTPSISATLLPGGSAFSDNHDGSGSFSWTPANVGVFYVTFEAKANNLVALRSARISVIDPAAQTQVMFADSSMEVNEDAGTVNLTVNMSKPCTEAVTVSYAVTGGTAENNGVDYTLTPGQLTFAVGETVKTIALNIVDDSIEEADENIQITLSSPSGAILGANSVLNIAIHDNDQTGNLLTADGDILKLFGKDSGLFLKEFVNFFQLETVGGFTYGTDADGNKLLYVSSRSTDSILRFDAKTGQFIDMFSSVAEIRQPGTLRFGYDGNLYVACQGNSTIIKLDKTTGALIPFNGNTTSIPFSKTLKSVDDFIFLPYGTILVASSEDSGVFAFNQETGNEISELVKITGITKPKSLLLDSYGKLYVADANTATVYKYDLETKAVLASYSDADKLKEPVSLGFDRNGKLYVGDKLSATVYRVDENNDTFVFTKFINGTSLFRLAGLAFADIVPEIKQQPANTAVTTAGNAGFKVCASGTESLSYQWMKKESGSSEGTAISGATSPILNIQNAGMILDGSKYYCVVSNYMGSVQSADATLTVNLHTLNYYAADSHGSITGTSPQSVDHGTSGSPVTAVPNTDYHFVSWSDGVLSADRTDSNVTGDISVTANFAHDTADLVVTAGVNGTTSGSISGVYTNTDTPVTAVSDPHYHFAGWTVTGGSASIADANAASTNVRLTGGNGSSTTIAAGFAIDTFMITSSAGANGSITPSAAVEYGADKTFTITPASNYHVANMLVDGESVPVAVSYTFTNVTATHTISASFAIDTHTVTFDLAGKGTRTGGGQLSQTVNHGSGATAPTITAITGWTFTDWDKSFNSITADTTVTAQYSIATYTVNYNAGANGSISGTTPQTVNHGYNGTPVSAVPNTGYHFVKWSDDVATAARTDSNVTGNISLTANFAINSYTLTYNAGGNGSITGTTPQTVNHGANGSLVTAVPNTGYHFVSWSDGVNTAARTDLAVTADKTVTANFAINSYTLTYNAGDNGSISGSTPQTVNHGSNGSPVTAVASTGYHFVSWNDGVTTATRTDSAVTGNMTVTATFALTTYPVTYVNAAMADDSGDGLAELTAKKHISSAIAIVDAGGTVNVAAGSYVEDVNINKALTLKGAQYDVNVGGRTAAGAEESTISGVNATLAAVTVNASNVVIDGFTITNPGRNNALNVSTTANQTPSCSDIVITHNIIENVGATSSLAGNVHAVRLYQGPDNVTISHNKFSNIKASAGTVSAIGVIDSASSNSSTGLQIDDNIFTDIATSAKKGTYGILLGNKIGAPGAQINNNTFSNLKNTYGSGGGWLHAIGLECPTADAVVSGNVFSDLTSGTPDNIALYFEANPTANTVTVAHNKFNCNGLGVVNSVATSTVNASSNWFGSAVRATVQAKVYGYVSAIPYFIDTEMTTLSNVKAITAFTVPNQKGSTIIDEVNHTIALTMPYGTNVTSLVPTITATGLSVSPSSGTAVNFATPQTYTVTSVDEATTQSYAVTVNVNIGITASAGANGSITPSGTVDVTPGTDKSFTITPDENYHVADVLVDGSSVGAATIHQFTNVTTSHSIAASFAINTYTLTYNAGLHGSINGTTPQTVNYGADGSQVTAVPDAGYHFISWSDGVATASRTDSNVTGNKTVTANFAINTYTLTYNAGANGSVNGTTPQTVNHGADCSQVTAVADSGYHFVSWSDGVNTAVRTDLAVTADKTVIASFAINTYDIVVTAGSHGSITPNGTVTRNHGTAQIFTIAPDANYHVADVLVDGTSVGAVSSYQFMNITAAHTISASFAIDTHTVTFVEGSNGTITGTKIQTVNHGSSCEAVTAVPATGYHFVNWTGDMTSTNNPLTVSNVVTDMTITANFAINTYTLTYTAGANGSITGTSPQTVNHGTDGSQVTAVPDEGYHFVSWSDSSTVNPRTDLNVTANATVTATFALTTYSITYVNAAMNDDSGDGSTAVTAKKYISSAIAITDAGGTVNVAAGTYGEALTICKSLTLNGAKSGIDARSRGTSSGESILDGTGLSISQHDAIMIANGVSNVVIDGFEIRNYHLNSTENGDGNAISSYCMGANVLGASNITVRNNYIHDLGYNGILVGSENNTVETMAVQTGWLIQYNKISNYKYAAVELTNVINSQVKDNDITAPTSIFDDPGDAGVGIEIAARSRAKPVTAGTNVEVSGNTITGAFPSGARAVINLLSRTYGSSSDATLSGITVSGNNISGATNVRAAVLAVAESRADGPATIGGLTITGNMLDGNHEAICIQDYVKSGSGSATHASINISGNELKNSAGAGLRLLASTSAEGITVASNKIISNEVSGIRHEGTGTLDASCNWFGSAVKTAVQSKVYGNVTFIPYFVNAEMTLLSNVKEMTAFTIPNQKGSTVINEANHTIVLLMPYGTNVSALVPSITTTGSSVSPASGTAGDFSSPKTYTVTSVDEATTQDYAVTVNVNIGITASAGANGTITPSGAVDVEPRANQSFDITPAANYHIAGLVVDNEPVLPVVSRYTFEDVTANHTITASFAIDTFMITSSAGEHGSITPSSAVDYGSDRIFTITPDANYHIETLVVDNVPIPVADSYKFTYVTAPHTISATFAIKTYTVTFDLAGKGTSASGGALSQAVDHGNGATAPTITASTGWTFTGWDRTFDSITADTTVTAQYVITTYTLTYTAGDHGSISGTTTQIVNHGDNGTPVTAVPDTGYHFVSWSDGVLTAARTDDNVTGDKSVTASFALNTYEITATAGSHGSITPGASVEHGSNKTFTITPDANYHVADVLVDGASVGAVESYQFTNVTATHTISATFAINEYTLTYNAGDHGSITGDASQSVGYGLSGTEVAATADEGYLFVIWSDGVKTPSRTDANVTENKTVTANFSLKVHTLTYNSGANGSISGTNPQKVHGAGNVFYSFEDIENNGQVTGIHSGINFGAEGYWSYSQAKSGLSGCGYFSDDVTSRSFTLPSGGYLKGLRIVGGGAHSYTVSDGVNTAVTGIMVANVPQTVTTGWTEGGVVITITTDGNQDVAIDEITYWSAAVMPAEVTAVPNTGYHFISWSDEVLTASRTESDVTADLAATANFAINTYDITATAGSHGSITPSASVNHGADKVITITPDANYHVADVLVDGSSVGHVTDYTFQNVTASHTISVSFAIDTHTVTFSGTSAGTVVQAVEHGGNCLPVTAGPATGYHFTGWTGDVTSANSPLTVTNVVSDMTITANFAINSYTLTYNAGDNGSITGTTLQTVNHGSDGSQVTAVPAANYHFVKWSDDVETVSRTDSNVTSDKTVSANFSIDTHTVTFDLAGKGTRTGGGALSQTVNHGNGASAPTVTANTGWNFTGWDKSFDSITSDTTVTAQYSIATYTLTYAAGANGSISGTSPQTVNHGSDGSQVTAVPNTGYHFVSWSDGVATASRTETNVTANKTVTASFAINTYTLTYAAGFHGAINGPSPQTVNHGADGSQVTATPDTGYHFTNWSDGLTTASRTEINVTVDKTVTASFAINTYTVTFAEGSHGTITGTKVQTIDHGSNTSQVAAVPDDGYQFVNWTGDVTDTSNSLTVSNVTANMTITANFALNPVSLFAMGHNGYGQLGDGTLTSRTTPVEILSSDVTTVATGYFHSLFIKNNGSLWAMGDNGAGQLGDGTTTGRSSPVQIVSSGAVAISAGNYHSLFLKADGSLWAMGENGDGQLGDGTTEWKSTPVQIVSSGVSAISAGAWHSLFLKTDGSLWAMGNNSDGELGDGTLINRNSPVQILSSGVTAISAGYWHSLFLKTDGSVWAMGSNGAGQLGDGTDTRQISPVQVMSSGVGAISASAGGYHSMFLKTNGSLWAAGSNGYGQLGDGSNLWRYTPVQIVSAGVTHISAGAFHTMFIKNDGSLWAMGWNSNGQLGDGTTTDRNTPVQILSSGANAVSSGFEHSLFLLENEN